MRVALYQEQKELKKHLPWLNYTREDVLSILAQIKVRSGGIILGDPRDISRIFPEDRRVAQGMVIHLLEPLLAAANLCDVDVEAAAWQKYPNLCPYCDQQLCACRRSGKKREHTRYNLPKQHHFSLRFLQGMFARIYPHDVPSNDPKEQLIALALRLDQLNEEITEIMHEVAKEGTFRDLQDEFADAFARLMALANTLGVTLD